MPDSISAVVLDYVEPKGVFLEARLLPELYEHLQARKLSLVVMDRPKKFWPGVYYFWDLVDQATEAEVGEDFVADNAARHISVLRFTGGTTGDRRTSS